MHHVFNLFHKMHLRYAFMILSSAENVYINTIHLPKQQFSPSLCVFKLFSLLFFLLRHNVDYIIIFNEILFEGVIHDKRMCHGDIAPRAGIETNMFCIPGQCANLYTSQAPLCDHPRLPACDLPERSTQATKDALKICWIYII